MDKGGWDLPEYLMLLLRRLGYSFHTSAEFELVKKIKECICNLKELTKDTGTNDNQFSLS